MIDPSVAEVLECLVHVVVTENQNVFPRESTIDMSRTETCVDGTF